ncbi:MAG: hypothetical protein ABI806_19610 [Candidatus Solibacter sp.]
MMVAFGGEVRRLHFILGWVTVVAFLITGQLMRHHSPPLVTMSDSVRLLYRSRHIYILSAGLLHLMLGIYWRTFDGWRRHVQAAGSVLLAMAVPLLVRAFFVEPARGLLAATPWSHFGLYALFGGTMLHALCGFKR